MKNTGSNKNICRILYLFFCISISVNGQVTTLDEFENTTGWNFVRSEGVDLNLSVDKGVSGNSLRLDYDFTKGTGYGGIQKLFDVNLPENYEFTFYLKAKSPANNFEIKFIDSSGNNVWWVNNRNYNFPEEWKKITVRKRHIQFAWGPAENRDLKRVARIEFTISSFAGGKGSIWLDDLKFTPLPPETHSYPSPAVRATSSEPGHPPQYILDDSDNTSWRSAGNESQDVIFDFRSLRQFGGLQIIWDKSRPAVDFDVFLSDDGRRWEQVFTVSGNRNLVSFIPLPEAESRFAKILLKRGSNDEGFGIAGIRFTDIANSMTPNDFFLYVSTNSLKGDYPRYFSAEASYWTVIGVNNDVKEALLNEDGMVEVEKGRFSLEPMIKIDNSLYNWSNVTAVQTEGKDKYTPDFTFIPTVNWSCNGLKFSTSVTAGGEANKNSQLSVRYSFTAPVNKPVDFDFYLLLRPFQVNPYYQTLNLTGGVGRIFSVKEENNHTISVDGKPVISLKPFDSFGASSFDEGNIVNDLRDGKMPVSNCAEDPGGWADGVLKYSFHLKPGENTAFYVVVPFYGIFSPDNNVVEKDMDAESEKWKEFWDDKTGYIHFNLPQSADRIIRTYRSNLAYILINRDNAGFQPGSRSYERSWIRDGALTSSALLKSGITKEVKEFIEWYSGYLYDNGKVPCVVDSRGPDPVPENDSEGEFIYLVREYFNFTHDTAFLRSENKIILKVVDYISSLIAETTTDKFRNGNDSVRSFYGLMPESISHEGYSAKPMHSYWDDFFTMKGLKDAAEIEKTVGDTAQYRRICAIRDTFHRNLYHSINLAMKRKGIDFIPGCAELGDFDATSTTIALTPCNELKNLPQPQADNTFIRYFRNLLDRRYGKVNWVNYTPYENRLIGSFNILDEPDKAHNVAAFLMEGQRPSGWYQWAEVVWKDYRYPATIGDMPHTWVGSDFINAIRSFFVYENEYDQTLELASALYQDWIDATGGMSVSNLPTYYGEISYSIRNEGNFYRFKITGQCKLPGNGIVIRNFNGFRLPSKVMINGRKTANYNNHEIHVATFPAEVLIYY